MAYTKKTASTSETGVKQSTSAKEDISKENDKLKSQLAELQEQMATLMAQMSNNKTTDIESKPRKDRTITFVNMTNGTVVLKGSQIWTIEGQFKSRKFSEREAVVILSNMNNLIRSGKVYIADADFVRDNDLFDAYQYILSDKDLKNLFDNDANYIIEVYQTVSEGQKQIIIDMITNRIQNGLTVDGNVLLKLGKLSGKDLMSIEPLEDE